VSLAARRSHICGQRRRRALQARGSLAQSGPSAPSTTADCPNVNDENPFVRQILRQTPLRPSHAPPSWICPETWLSRIRPNPKNQWAGNGVYPADHAPIIAPRLALVSVRRCGAIFANWASVSQKPSGIVCAPFGSFESRRRAQANNFIGLSPRFSPGGVDQDRAQARCHDDK